MQSFPGHLLGPTEHRLHIDQLRAIPLQLQDTPASFDGIIFAVIRRIIEELNRLVDHVSELHHAREKLCTSAATLRTVVHLDLELTRGGLLLLIFFFMLSKIASVSLSFFCGLAFTTLRKRKPMRLSTSAIVLGEGSCSALYPWSRSACKAAWAVSRV